MSIVKTKYGDGSVYFSKSDSRWEFSVMINGKEHKRTAKTKSKLFDKIKILEDAGTIDCKRMTVSALLDLHMADLNSRMERGNRKESTVGFNRERVKKLKESIGHIRVVNLTADHVERMMDSLNGGSSYKQQHRSILRCALNRFALKKGIVHTNAASLAEPPEKDLRRDLTPPTESEMEAIIQNESDPIFKAMWAIMAGCGLRPQSEARVFKWSYFQLKDDGWWFRLDDSKTEAGKAENPVPQWVMDLVFNLPSNTEFVFSNPKTGLPFDKRWVLTCFHYACRNAGIRPRGADLVRKYACTKWAKTAREEQLKRLGRHTDSRTTRQFYVKPGEEGLREITG